jgi:hypothetical protein
MCKPYTGIAIKIVFIVNPTEHFCLCYILYFYLNLVNQLKINICFKAECKIISVKCYR